MKIHTHPAWRARLYFGDLAMAEDFVKRLRFRFHVLLSARSSGEIHLSYNIDTDVRIDPPTHTAVAPQARQ